MTHEEINDWDNRTGYLTKKDLLKLTIGSEIRVFKEDFPKGNILDLGIGLGAEALYFISLKRKVYAVDKEIYFLDRLRKISNGQVETMQSEMPNGQLPDEKFALIILSNLLHFLSYEDSRHVCKRAAGLMFSGSYAVIRVHSDKHPYAAVGHVKNKKFKHFFKEHEIKELFPSREFDIKFFADYQRHLNKLEAKIMGLGKDAIYNKAGYVLIVQKK